MMEFDDIVVKENPGLCRCCLSEGCYKDLGSEYTWMNENEVYADMLLECFDISISQINEGPNGPNRLICEVCITRLRDACNFKKQVFECEKKFIDMVARGEFRKVLIYQAHMKSEEVGPEDEIPADESEYLEEDPDFGDDEPLKREEPQPTVSAEPLQIKGKRGRPKKQPDAKPEKKKSNTDDKKTKPVAKDVKCQVKQKRTSKFKRDSVRSEMKSFMSCALELTTVMPFKWYLSRYMCFYCEQTFVDSLKLKQHTKQAHREIKINKVMKRIGPIKRIKWDITEIKCKKCEEQMSNIEEFIIHARKHNLFFDSDVVMENLYVFRLSDDGMFCVHCGEGFKFFTPLLRHTNKYHNKSEKFICDVCKESFVLKGTLRSHIENVHSDMPYRCRLCPNWFPTRRAYSNHTETSHRTGKFSCPHCTETLSSRYLRNMHLATKHDLKTKQFGCDVCAKVFFRKSSLIGHKARAHLKERSATCHVCGLKAFDVHALKLHMAVHDNARPLFNCVHCGKVFKWKRCLALHKRRKHQHE